MQLSPRAHLVAYFTVNGALRFSVTVPQAFLTPILVSKGLSFSQIALIQSLYMFVSLGSEIPSGYFADLTSRRFAYLSSIVVTAAGYLVVASSSGVSAMAVAWALYGLGQSLQSSTMEFHFVARLRQDPRAFTRFFVLERSIPLGASVAAALLASVLFPHLGSALYWVSVAGFAACFLLGVLTLPGEKAQDSRGLAIRAAEVRSEVVAAFRSRSLTALIAWVAMTQIGFTALYQFWQMAFLGSGVDSRLFGVLFIGFQGAAACGHWVFGRVAAGRHVLVLSAAGAGALALSLLLAGSAVWVIAASLLLGTVLIIHANAVEFEFQSRVPEGAMSSIASVMNALSSAVALAVLAVASALIDRVPARDVLAWGVLAFAAVMLAFALTRARIMRVREGDLPGDVSGGVSPSERRDSREVGRAPASR